VTRHPTFNHLHDLRCTEWTEVMGRRPAVAGSRPAFWPCQQDAVAAPCRAYCDCARGIDSQGRESGAHLTRSRGYLFSIEVVHLMLEEWVEAIMPDAATDITEIKPTQPRSAEAARMHRRGSARQCAWGENREGADVPEQIGSNRDSTQPRRSCQALCLGRPWHIDRDAMRCR